MKGIIYKIECNETGEVYYGSTQRSLNKRMIDHKKDCKRWKEGKRGFTTSYNIIDRGNYSYSLIETVECEDKRQLEARERFYIESNECINKVIPCRTEKERYEANKEAILEHQKEYKKANKDHISEYHKEYKRKNKERWNEYMREYQRQRAKAKILKNI